MNSLNSFLCKSIQLHFSFSTLVISFLFLSTSIFAQVNNFEDPTYKAIQSPNAYSLGKFGEIPVSLYTGVPNLSVPITEISIDGYTLPISLSYHSGGIKAQERASWVGLGWTLNAGGVITRSVVGNPDDDISFQGYAVADIGGSEVLEDTNFMNWSSNTNPTSNEKQAAKVTAGSLERIPGNDTDTQPDVFFYNFGEYSGKIILPPDLFDGSGNANSTITINTIPHSTLKIEIVGATDSYGIVSWKLTDGAGVQYIFDKDELHINSNITGLTDIGGGAGSTHVDDRISWYLSEIHLPNSDEVIELNYTDKEDAYYHSRAISLKTDQELPSWDSDHFTTFQRLVNETQSLHKVRRLTSIETRSHIIYFETDNQPDRYDAPIFVSTNKLSGFPFGLKKQEYSLQKIKLYAKDGANESLLRVWDFNYGYFNNSVSYHLGHTNSENEPDLFKRLKLESVEIQDSQESTKETFGFEYNEGAFSFKYYDYDNESFVTPTYGGNPVTVSLPPYLDYVEPDFDSGPWFYPSHYHPAYDHWGFFNAQFENAFYNVPQVDYSNYEGPSSVDRSPNEAAMKSGILSKITYPTGGYTEFEFEANRYRYVGNVTHTSDQVGGGLRVKSIKNYESPGSDPITKTFKYIESGTGYSAGVLVNEPVYLKPFFIEDKTGQNLDYWTDLTWGFGESSLIPLGSSNGGIVSYREVKEIYGESESENGYKVSSYTSPYEFPYGIKDAYVVNIYEQYQDPPLDDIVNYYENLLSYYFDDLDPSDNFTDNITPLKWGFGQRTNLDSRRGKLISEVTFNSNNQKITEILNEYLSTEEEYSDGTQTHNRFIGVSATNIEELRTDETYSIIQNFDLTYVIQYEHVSSLDLLEKTTTRVYEAGTTNYSETIKEYEYNLSNLAISNVTETNSLTGEKRVTKYEYAYEQYSGMATANMLTQPYSALIEDGSGNDLSKNWTEWTNSSSISPNSKWRVWKQWLWDGSGTPTDPPSDTETTPNDIKISTVLEYDAYGNPLEIEAANGLLTKFYYGSNGSPFQNATSTANAVNGVPGVYLTGIQKVQGTDDCPTNCGTRPGSGNDLFTEAEYDELGRISTIIDENNQSVSYLYDDFGRLISTRNANGLVTSSYGYGYSASMNGGTYSSASPNQVESVTYVDPIYYTGFTTSSGWSSVDSHNTFNVEAYGETTVRMGGNGTHQPMSKSIGEENVIARIDFYPDNTTGGAPRIYFDGGGNRFAVQYLSGSDEFRIQYRISPTTGFSYPFTFPMDAPPNQWYTIELQKSGGELTAWVYPKGQGRDPDNKHSETGFSTSWQPQFRLSTEDNYFYAANLSIAKSSISNTSYLDGLGREIQSQARGGDKVIATETLYNERGLPEVVSRPIETTTSAFPGFYSSGLLSGGNSFTPGSAMPAAAPVASYYAPYHTGTNDDDELYAYSNTQYEDSPLARVEKSTLPGEDHQTLSTNAVTTTYGLNTTETFKLYDGETNEIEWLANKLSKTISKDPDGKKTITYIDGWGQTIASGVDMNTDGKLTRASSDLVTEFAYDVRGNLVRVEDPRGLVTTYTYNTLGQLESKQLPDQYVGATKYPHTYRYDKKGRLRFHRDPNLDAGSDHYYYTKYDKLDRPVEVGIRTSSAGFDSDIDVNNQSFPSSSNTVYATYSYDGDNPYTGHTPNNTKGRLTKTSSKDPNGSYWASTWYSYNELGLVEWVIQSPAIPTSAYTRKIEYSYDQLGRMTRMFFNSLSTSLEDHYFWYYYDELGRLKKVTSYGSNSEGSALTEAEYSYYADGQVKQLTLGDGAQIVDYDYTIQGWLENINDGVASGSDQFGMALEYHENGNISQQQWAQQSASNSNLLSYTYTNDNANRLTSAQFSGNGYNPTAFDVTYGYDKSGNLEGITRNNNSGGTSSTSPFIMNVPSYSNRLTDFEDGTTIHQLGYDANGNMTSNTQQGITATTYDWRNLPTSVTANGSTLTYMYDAEGNRIKKQIGSTTTWYVRGADGQTIAAYDGSGNLLFINILAGGQIIGQIDN